MVQCRICKGDHWTTKCPYKDTLGPTQKELADQLGLTSVDNGLSDDDDDAAFDIWCYGSARLAT